MCGHVVRIQCQRRRELAFGLCSLLSRPVEVHEREVGGCRSFVELHALLQRLLRGFGVAPTGLELAEIRVRTGTCGRETNGLLHLGDRPVDVLQARECVPEQDVRVDVLRRQRQRLLRPHLRIVETAADEEQRTRLQLHVRAIGQHVGRPHVLPRRVGPVLIL